MDNELKEMEVPEFIEEDKQSKRKEVLNFEHLQELRRSTSIFDEEDARAACEVLCENFTSLYAEVLTEWIARAKEDVIFFLDKGADIFLRNQRINGMGDRNET